MERAPSARGPNSIRPCTHATARPSAKAAAVSSITSTVSGNGDTGADPNQVVAVTDQVSATTLPATESFSTVLAPTDGVVYRGVSFTPTTSVPNVLAEVPWAPLLPISLAAIGAGTYAVIRRRRLLAHA